jgi:hypothetical protein
MKELEIKILEEVSNNTLDTNDILRRLLVLYGVTERYFYHSNITHKLIECDKSLYDKLNSNNDDRNYHKPVKYMSDQIPTDKKLCVILYK